MKKLLLLTILILTPLLTSCQGSDDGGGVIPREEPTDPSNPPYEGPFGGPINNDDPIPPASPYLPPYNSIDLQALIDNTTPGNVLELDRDVILNSITVIIPHPITIKSAASLGRKVKIKGILLTNAFAANTNNIIFRDLDFELISVLSFVSAPLDLSGVPVYTDLLVQNCSFLLRGTSSLEIFMNGLDFRKNTVLGLANSNVSEKPLIKMRSNNSQIIGNVIVDVKNTYMNALLFGDSTNVTIKENVMRSFGKVALNTVNGLFGTITGSDANNVSIESNILHDGNSGRSPNNGIAADPDIDGSITMTFQYSNNVRDNGLNNKFAANHQVIDDSLLSNGSTNITFGSGVSIPDFGPNQLFNFPATEDFTPICALGTNPSLSTTPVLGWNSYTTRDAGVVYYAGALKPACPTP